MRNESPDSRLHNGMGARPRGGCGKFDRATRCAGSRPGQGTNQKGTATTPRFAPQPCRHRRFSSSQIPLGAMSWRGTSQRVSGGPPSGPLLVPFRSAFGPPLSCSATWASDGRGASGATDGVEGRSGHDTGGPPKWQVARPRATARAPDQPNGVARGGCSGEVGQSQPEALGEAPARTTSFVVIRPGSDNLPR
jgi:hypothetical protein